MSKKTITFYDSEKKAHEFPIVTHDYGVCDTESDVDEKIVTCDDFSLFEGAEITVKFSNAVTVSDISLNVNETGKIPVRFDSSGSNAENIIESNGCYGFVYDGTSWIYKGSRGVGKITNNGGEIFNDYENNLAQGTYSHVEGTNTYAGSYCQHVEGKYNVKDDDDDYIHIAGNGTSDENRSNAYTLDWDGNVWFAGGITLGEDKVSVATIDIINALIERISILEDTIKELESALDEINGGETA